MAGEWRDTSLGEICDFLAGSAFPKGACPCQCPSRPARASSGGGRSTTWPESSPGGDGFGAGLVPGSGDCAKVRKSSTTSSRFWACS